jgi:glutathione synthase/RimK-type ligase-like ATP-grasp enzyme
VIEQATRFFARPRVSEPVEPRFELAILFNPDEVDSPSDARAIRKFQKAANAMGIRSSIIGSDDLGRIAEYDALFIRETTSVTHHTYRFASRAEAEGLVVIDDAESIVRCSNKVYQAELFDRHDIACPKTVIVHRDNTEGLAERLGFPIILKKPDSFFSMGVVKAGDEQELAASLDSFFETSELVVAQEYVHSEFDWRIGVLDCQPLWACRYHMARGHWQIQRVADGGGRKYGRVEAVALADAPSGAVAVAVKAANLIGDGLYGVDVKQVGDRFLVMEVNDNPNLEAGYEDGVLKDELYTEVMKSFLRRLEQQGRSGRT